MRRNRLTRWLSPNPHEKPIALSGLMACPLALQHGATEDLWARRCQLYQWAMDQASAVVRPSIVERWQGDLLN
jgi:hypothetical protein